MRFAGTIIAVMLLSACGPESFRVGPTRIVVQRDATPWPDLPDVLWLMQAQARGAPDALWDTRVVLWPPHKPLSEPLAVCLYDVPTGHIHARTHGATTGDGCIAHEFAHRRTHLRGLGLGHGEDWERYMEVLSEAGKKE